jgi:aldehyde dehydrogenase (NAD+)
MKNMPAIENTPSARTLAILKQQTYFFNRGATLPFQFRINKLKLLKQVLQKHELELLEALKADTGKPTFEAFASELGFLYDEINYTLKNLKQWMAPERVNSPLIAWPSKSYIKPSPKGTTLVIAPWNYPLQLALAPALAAMAAGNTVLIKPAEQTPKTSLLLEKIIAESFNSNYLAVVQGQGHVVLPPLIKNHNFGHVFFTGSVPVGRKIAALTAPKLIATTLELGGKSPAIIDGSANLKVAARRIAFGKWLNAGQTCVAPDYLLVQRSQEASFIKHLKHTLKEFYPMGALQSNDYTRLINQKRYRAIENYLKDGQAVIGGQKDPESLKIEPTVLKGVSLKSDVMQEEIFGPVLPLLTFDKPKDAIAIINKNPNPLAFYLFSQDKNMERTFLNEISFGGGAVNNTVIHLSNPRLPFGGVGNSGIGSYHGIHGFNTFSHQKSIMKTATWFDLKAKYPPYSKWAYKAIKWLMK